MIEVRKNEVMEKVRQINDKISRSYENDIRTFEALSDKLKIVTTGLEKQKRKREAIEDSKRDDIRQLSQNFVREVGSIDGRYKSSTRLTAPSLQRRKESSQINSTRFGEI